MKKLFTSKPLFYISALFVIISGAVFINNSISFLFPDGYIQNQKAQVSDALSPTLSIYVSTTGSDTNAGTADAPVATIGKALSLIDTQPESGEIIIRGGIYKISTSIEIKPPTATGLNPNRTILIRAADGETPIFDGGIEVTPTPMEGEPGIFLISGSFPSSGLPQVWEENNRIRYNSVIDLTTLKSVEYSMFAVSPTQLAIHPKGGSLPAQGELRLSTADYGFDITRNNVKVKNLTFKGFGKTYASAGIKVGGNSDTPKTEGVLIESSNFSNSYSGVYFGRGTGIAEIRNCTIRDVASGINQWGGFVTIEHNDIRNDNSLTNLLRFKNFDSMTGGGGLFIYTNSVGGTYKYNLIYGFIRGIFIKTIEPGGPFIIEHNTIVSDQYYQYAGVQTRGIDFVRYSNYGKENAIIRYNIIDGFDIPFTYDSGLTTTGAVIDRNIFWKDQSSYFENSYIKPIKEKGMGNNLLSSPLFINKSAGDFNISLDSPAITISDDGKPAGAFEVKSDNVAPILNASIDYIYQRQWQEFVPTNYSYTYTIASSSVVITLSPSHTVRSTKISVSTENQQNDIYSDVREYTASTSILLPPSDGLYIIKISVQDFSGAWSNIVSFKINKNTSSYAFNNDYVRSNKYGFVVFGKDSKNGWHTIYYREKGNPSWIKGFNTLDYQNTYTAPYVDMRNIGEQPMVVVGLKPDTLYEYKIVYNSGVGSSSIYEIKTFGSPKTYYISPNGIDTREGGSKDKPFKTLQYAIDLSLPGDDIRLLPGVYFGTNVMFHSGTSDYPIIIEADEPGTVILDAQQIYNVVLWASGVSNVKVKNLHIQSAKNVGFGCYNCNFVEISGNTFQNSILGAHNILGVAISVSVSNNSSIHHNLIYSWWRGVFVGSSPNTDFHNNTILATAVTGLEISDFSKSQGSSFTYNSINFTGNSSLNLTFNNASKGNIVIDYNNYGTTFISSSMSKVDNNMKIVLPYSILYNYEGREFINQYPDVTKNWTIDTYHSFSKWKSDSGFDAHSIFADPLWVDPLNGKFNLKPESPNLLPGGKYIGAFNTEVVVNNVQYIPPPVTNENIDNTLLSSPSPTPTPTPLLRATDGICGTTLNSCTQGILRNTEDSTTQYLWMCLGSNNGFDASCSQNRYIPPVTTNPPTNPVVQTQNPRVNQTRTPSTYKPQPTIYKTGTTPNKDTYTINIPTSTIDITLPKPPSWLDVIKTLLNKIITNVIRGVKRTGEVVGI